MYQIRFYYKNDDKNLKQNITYEIYGTYETYEKACEEIRWLINIYKEIECDEVIFTYSIPKKIIEPYILFSIKKNKAIATIVSE